MIRDYSPIDLCGKVSPPYRCIPAPMPKPLEPAPALPCYEGMDDTADWMHNGGREILEGMLVCECPEADHA